MNHPTADGDLGLRTEITALVTRELRAVPQGRAPTGPDEPLMACGLDSLLTVRLLVRLEGHFELEMPPEDISAETFRTVRSLARAVARAQQGTRRGAVGETPRDDAGGAEDHG